MKVGKLGEQKMLEKNRKKYLWKTEKKEGIIKNETNEEKSPIGIKRGQGNKKKEKKDNFHTRRLVVESIIGLDKIRKIVPEKRYYHENNETIWFNVYKQYHGLKRNPRKIKSLPVYEGFQLQYEQERVDKEKKQKEKLFQNADGTSKSRKNNAIS